MKYKLAFTLMLFACWAKAQDTTSFRIAQPANAVINLKVDTNELVYTAKGKALRYYQYKKLIESGRFRLRVTGDVNSKSRKLLLKRI
jgi:ABC-type uncharacterized transport system auxiliary subunit